MSQSFSETPSGLQLIRFLEPQGCDITQNWESPVPNAIKWRRKVRAEWNELLGYFVPIPEEIRPERHILVVIKADEFASLAIGKTDLAGHVRTLKRALGESSSTKLIYIIEGLTALRRKSRNAKSRSFQGAVRQAVAGEEGGVVAVATTTTRSRNRATRSAIVDEDALDNALLSLQVIYDCLVHETVNSMDTSEWISIFTGDISTIPYK